MSTFKRIKSTEFYRRAELVVGIAVMGVGMLVAIFAVPGLLLLAYVMLGGRV